LNKNICGNKNFHLRREAVAGTVKVYPMKNGDEIYADLIAGITIAVMHIPQVRWCLI